MKEIEKELIKWNEDISKYHIPRWDELPDIDLYMDQVITFIEKHLCIFSDNPSKKVITPSMINNYVKLKLIPKPIKKRYNKVHLAYLIAIYFLKQIVTIEKIRDGIIFQAKINGKKGAYNLFCQEQERALKSIMTQINTETHCSIFDSKISPENLAVKTATLAFASKIIAEKAVELQKNFIAEQSNKSNDS